jgi:RHS repeat-associated protein
MIRIAEPLPSDEGPYEYRGRFDADAMFEFAGDFNADAELHCEQTRWYDPTVGRWLSEDVVGFADSCNLYRYVGNSPMQPDASALVQI